MIYFVFKELYNNYNAVVPDDSADWVERIVGGR
jgi:hypothetical protein